MKEDMNAQGLIAFAGLQAQDTEAQLARINSSAARFGLALAADDIQALSDSRHESLKQNERIEFEGGILEELVAAFCSSPYLQQSTLRETLLELQGIFYRLKDDSSSRSATGGGVPDDVLLFAMRAAFDGPAGGSCDELEALSLQDILVVVERQDDDEPDGELTETYRLVDDAGKVYTWNPDEWQDDEYCDGWNGEKWSDDF